MNDRRHLKNKKLSELKLQQMSIFCPRAHKNAYEDGETRHYFLMFTECKYNVLALLNGAKNLKKFVGLTNTREKQAYADTIKTFETIIRLELSNDMTDMIGYTPLVNLHIGKINIQLMLVMRNDNQDHINKVIRYMEYLSFHEAVVTNNQITYIYEG